MSYTKQCFTKGGSKALQFQFRNTPEWFFGKESRFLHYSFLFQRQSEKIRGRMRNAHSSSKVAS